MKDEIEPFPTEQDAEPFKIRARASTPATDLRPDPMAGLATAIDEMAKADPPFITSVPPVEMLRYNQGKPRASLIPASFNYYTAQVLEYGAVKYSANNWRKGCKWNDLLDSLQRHLDSFKAGEDCDDESQLPHLAHMAFNVMALIEFYDQGLGTDDRFLYPDQAPTQRRPGRVLTFRAPPRRE